MPTEGQSVGLPSDYCLTVKAVTKADKSVSWHAYNDAKGVTKRFILNGLTHANRILGLNLFLPEDWDYGRST